MRLAKLVIASPASLTLFIEFSMALLEILLDRKSIFLLSSASRASISFLFHSPATTMGVPIYMRRERANKHVSCYTASCSSSLSLHLRAFRFLWIYSLAVFLYSFKSTFTLTPRYLTVLVHLTPPISSSLSAVRISDIFLFSLRLYLNYRDSISSMAFRIFSF
jgi:hypothetical protein